MNQNERIISDQIQQNAENVGSFSSVPFGLRDYVALWTQEHTARAEERLSDMPSDPAQVEGFLRSRKIPMNGMLHEDPSQWITIAAQSQVNESLGGRLPSWISQAGFISLGQDGTEAYYEDVARTVYEQTEAVSSWLDVSDPDFDLEALFGSQGDEARRQIDILSGRGKMTGEERLEALKRWHITVQFEEGIRGIGEEYLQTNVFDPSEKDTDGNFIHPKLKDIKNNIRTGRIFQRAKEGVYQDTEYWDRNISRQVDAYHRYGGVPGEVLYKTSQTLEISHSLHDMGIPGAEIPWRVVEGPVQVEREVIKRLEDYAAVSSYAMELAYRLVQGGKKITDLLKDSGVDPDVTRTLSQTLRMLSQWKIPEGFPILPRRTNVPLILSRPDLARVEKDGNVQWVPTEHENAPGGLGMLLVTAEGYETDNGRELLDTWATMMNDIALPNDTIDRNRLTLVMSEDWGAYGTDMQLFLNALSQEHQIDTEVITIEDIARGAEVPSGFVFHFAYPWNLVQEGRDTTVFSENEDGESLRNATEDLYQRHGNDVYIFNDPSFGLLMYSKVGMSMYKLPGFAQVLEGYLSSEGLTPERRIELLKTFYDSIPNTTPLLYPHQDVERHVASAIGQAIAVPEDNVVKLAFDPNGQEDWGARGVTYLGEADDPLGEIYLARNDERPFVLQGFVTHAKWEQPRVRSQFRARAIDGDSREKVLVFNNDPQHPFLDIGEAVPVTVGARWNPFFLTYRNRSGEMTTHVVRGSITLTPLEDGQYKVHGTSQSAEVPVIIKEEYETSAEN